MNWWLLRKSVVTSKCMKKPQPPQNLARKARGSRHGLVPLVVPGQWGHHKLPVLCWMLGLAGRIGSSAHGGDVSCPAPAAVPAGGFQGIPLPCILWLVLALLALVWGLKAEQCPRASPWLSKPCCTKLCWPNPSRRS